MSEVITTITAQTSVKGEMHLGGPSIIAGRVQGNITTIDTLELTAEGVIEGDIEGTTLTIDGMVKGNITAAQACRLGPTARVAGDICVAHLAIAEGARFIGHVCVGEIEAPAKEAPGKNRLEDAAEETAAIQAVEATIAHVEQVAARLDESVPPNPTPAPSAAPAPTPSVQIMSETVQAALRRGVRVIKAR
jgi:cytoskeletal protein CcmA (bactofilin family)